MLMKKNIILQSLAFLALFVGSGCSRESLHSDGQGEGLKITLSCGYDTKATQDGVGNENLIKTVDVFLFKKSDLDTYGESATYTYRFHEEPSASTNYTMYIGSAFATEEPHTIYAIVNAPYTSESERTAAFGDNSSQKSLSVLKALSLSESSRHTFTKGASAPYSLADEGDLALVMTGRADNVAISTSSGTNIVGTADIDLSRLAAKVTMDFYLQDELVNDVKGDGSIIETWTPVTEGGALRAYLCNGNESIELGYTTVPTVGSASLFDYEPSTQMTSITGKSGYSAAFTMPSFYTYPESWTKGDVNEPYIKLIAQWQLSRTTATGTTTSQKETYYKVMLPNSISQFERNTWYNLVLDVTQLGGTSERDAVPVVPSYQVADWGEENIVISTLVKSYYLSVSEENKNLNFYTDKVEIPFTSSGNVSLASVTITMHDYLTDEMVTIDNAAKGWVSINNTSNLLTINRHIASNFPDEYDVSRYIFDIVLHLDDDVSYPAKYDQTLRVTQYPPLFITSLDGTATGDSSPTVYINGKTEKSSSAVSQFDNSTPAVTSVSLANASHFLGSLSKPSNAIPAVGASGYTGVNQNPNLYTVSSTHISFSVTYGNGTKADVVIGDPRGPKTNKFSETSDLLNGNGGSALTNYRPAAEDTKNVIAPQFMSASSYGKSVTMSYEGAVKRCASYQEYGYPAGRWRLPTLAEIEFLQELNADGKIPSLYEIIKNPSDNFISGYWAAGKEIYVNPGFVDVSGATLSYSSSNFEYNNGDPKVYRASVRCVYDTWYWGDNHSTTTAGSWLGFKTNLNDTF